MALLGAATVAYLLAAPAGPVSATASYVLALAVVACAAVLLAAAARADRVARDVHQKVSALGSSITEGRREVQRLLEQLHSGERPVLPSSNVPPPEGSDMFALLEYDLNQAQFAAQAALLQASILNPAGGTDQRVEVFVNLARRLQSLVHRAIQLLDELENEVEDPDLLKGLFYVDHLATRIRRHAENLAVLGGAVSRRQWSRPVTLTEVLRSAIAEVEQYSRVKLVPPIEGTLRGHAVADIIHLVAELVENATVFSPPHTQVLLRAQHVTAGLAVEVEDRGLGMSLTDQHRMNELLADPERIDIGELLRDGRIGLFVVSAIARRHGIAVRLQTNIYGGVQAVVILPQGLLGAPPQNRELREQPRAQQTRQPVVRPEPQPALTAPTSAVLPTYPAHPAPVAPARVTVPADRPVPVFAYSNDHGQAPTYPHSNDHGQAPTYPHSNDHGQAPTYPHSNDQGQSGRPGRWESPTGRTTGASAPPPGGPAPHPTGGHDVRPQLPQRRGQTHLAPQLQRAPASRRDEPLVGHDPGLMASFMRGVTLADTEADGGYILPGSTESNS
jgi:signal transduction histidine kinase